MTQNTGLIGLHPDELRCVQMLISLLRHPDPLTPELARQALLYLSHSAGESAAPANGSRAV